MCALCPHRRNRTLLLYPICLETGISCAGFLCLSAITFAFILVNDDEDYGLLINFINDIIFFC